MLSAVIGAAGNRGTVLEIVTGDLICCHVLCSAGHLEAGHVSAGPEILCFVLSRRGLTGLGPRALMILV